MVISGIENMIKNDALSRSKMADLLSTFSLLCSGEATMALRRAHIFLSSRIAAHVKPKLNTQATENEITIVISKRRGLKIAAP